MDRPWSPDIIGAALVRSELINAFRECVTRPIWSMPGGGLELVSGHHMSGLELILATGAILGRKSDKRTALLGWARAKAGGPSLAMLCKSMGWGRSSVDNWAAEGALLVAIALHGVATGSIELDRTYRLGITQARPLTIGKAGQEPASLI